MSTNVTQKLDALQNDDPRAKELELTQAEIAELAANDAVAQNKTRNFDMREHISNTRTEEFEEEVGYKLNDEEENEEGKPIEKPEENKEDVQPKVKVKVDGQTEELTQEQLNKRIETYQKHKAADKRLEENALLKKQIDQERATLNQALEDFNQQKLEFEKTKKEMSTHEKTQAQKALDISEDQISMLVKAIREGEDADATTAMIQFVKTLKTPPQEEVHGPSGEEIKTQINEGIEAALKKVQEDEKQKSQAEFEKVRSAAEKVFEDTYSDQIEGDNAIKGFYDHAIMYDNLLQTDDEWKDKSLEDRFIEAGRRAEAFLKGEPITNKVKSEETNSKKENIVNLPTHSNKKAVIGDDEPERTPVQSILTEIRRARHQL